MAVMENLKASCLGYFAVKLRLVEIPKEQLGVVQVDVEVTEPG